MILSLEATRSVLISPTAAESSPDPYGRTPFEHPALGNVDKLISQQPQKIVDKDRIYKLGQEIGLLNVMRWKPRLVRAAVCLRPSLGLANWTIAREPGRIRCDGGGQPDHVCHRRRHLINARRRGGPARCPRQDPQEAGRMSSRVSIDLYHTLYKRVPTNNGAGPWERPQ